MTRALFTVTLIAITLLTACEDKAPDRVQSYSEQGLPEAQRTQENSAAGVKFNDKTTFKPLSESDQRK